TRQYRVKNLGFSYPRERRLLPLAALIVGMAILREVMVLTGVFSFSNLQFELWRCPPAPSFASFPRLSCIFIWRAPLTRQHSSNCAKITEETRLLRKSENYINTRTSPASGWPLKRRL